MHAFNAINAGNSDSFDGFTYSNVVRYCPDASMTIMGHLAQQCQNVKSPKLKPMVSPPAPALPVIPPATMKPPSNESLSKYTPSASCLPMTLAVSLSAGLTQATNV